VVLSDNHLRGVAPLVSLRSPVRIFQSFKENCFERIDGIPCFTRLGKKGKVFYGLVLWLQVARFNQSVGELRMFSRSLIHLWSVQMIIKKLYFAKLIENIHVKIMGE
jgi:hypothetical protein